MSSAVAALYEPLIERDLDAVPAAVRTFRESQSSEELFLAVARFAVLAYAPSQHARHALLASLSAYELRDEYGDRWDDILIECARYAAEGRQPWSEPPVLEPPEFDSAERSDLQSLRAAVAAHDRLAAERWLAARMDDPGLSADLLAVAADDFEDFGHKLIVTSAVLKLADILGAKGRYAALRVAVWEMTSYDGPAFTALRTAPSDLYERLVENVIAEKGSLESMHRLFLYRAGEGTPVFDRVCSYLSEVLPRRYAAETGGAPVLHLPPAGLPVYRLARDYGQCLKAFALRDPRLRGPALYNLEHAESFADWSFA